MIEFFGSEQQQASKNVSYLSLCGWRTCICSRGVWIWVRDGMGCRGEV